MDTVFVKVSFDIYCDWQGIPPIYRIYLDNELFTERTWIWTDSYLNEVLQIQAPPGKYTVKLETVEPTLAKFQMDNFAVEYGPARWMANHVLEISR